MQSEPARVSAPFHQLHPAHAASSAVNGHDDRQVWMNAPAAAPVSDGHGTGSPHPSHRVNQFGQPPGLLLSTHLQVVTQMQTQLHTFKAQMRQFIENVVKYSTVNAEQAANAAAPGGASSAALQAAHKEIQHTAYALFSSHSNLISPLMSHTDRVQLGPRTLSKREMFGQSKNRSAVRHR